MGSKKSAILALSVAAIGIVAAGCAQHNSSQPAPPVQTLQTAAPAQPYTVVASLPVKPAVVEQRRRALHLTRRNNQFYLADNTGDYYDVGRDPNGNLYPVYYDREIGQYSPLYYDGARDRYYCAVQENGRFYRRYWNDPRDLYYDNQFDYADYNPPVEDRPVVYVQNDYYRGYNTYNRPGVHRTHDNAWLWALPVVAIAFIALSQHGHHSSHPVFVAHNPRPAYIYRAQPARHGPFIVSQRQNITVRQQVVRQPAPFRRNPAVVSLRTPPMRFRNQHVASRPAAPPFFRPGARPMQPMRHPARVAVAPRKPATRVAFRPAHRAPANTGPVARKRRAFFAHHQAKPVAVQPAPPLRKIAWHRTSLPRPSHPAMKTAPRQTIPARAAQHRPQITPGHQMRPGHQNAAASFTRPMPHRMAHPMRSNPIRPPAYHPPSGPPMAHAAQQHSNRPAAMVANRPAPMASNNKGHFQKGNHGNKHNGHK